MKSNKAHNRKSELGVTILLALLILASTSAVAFTIGSIVYSEIKAASGLVRTEVGLYGAQSALEESLFVIRRGVPLPGNTYSRLPELISARTENCPASTRCLTPTVDDYYPNEPYIASVSPDSKYDFTKDKTPEAFVNPTSIYLINPNYNTSTSEGAGYTKLTLQNISNTDIRYVVCELTEDTNTCNNDKSDYMLSNSNRLVNPTISADKSYVILLYKKEGSALTDYRTGYVQIWVEGKIKDAVGVDKTLNSPPYFLSKGVDVKAEYNNLVRKYRAVIPVQ